MSLNPWIRLYREALHDPKLVCLTDRQHRAWHNCLLISDDTGTLPALRDVASHMRMSVVDATALLVDLVEAELIDADVMSGPVTVYRLHGWATRQYTSDASKERVKRYRERRKQSGLPQQHHVTHKQRAAILAKTGGKCGYCGTTEKITIDHMVPVGRGGTDDPDNLMPACRPCNSDKRDMTHDEYMAWDGRVTKRNGNGNGHVTLPSRPKTSESYSEPEQNPLGLPSSLGAAREKNDQGILNRFGGRRQDGRHEKIIRRAEGLGVPVDDLVAAVSQHKPKNRSAYFTALCVEWFRKRLPGVDEPIIRNALWGTEAQYAVVLNLMVAAP